jgi:hypothetical protein
MAVLPRFDTPARLPEPADADRDAWSKRVGGVVDALARNFPQFFDPTATDPGPEVQEPAIAWTAFPATLLEDATSEEGRWAAADANRGVQDEYCEWAVERDADGVLTRVTFTTEVPEYFEHLAERARTRKPQRLPTGTFLRNPPAGRGGPGRPGPARGGRRRVAGPDDPAPRRGAGAGI